MSFTDELRSYLLRVQQHLPRPLELDPAWVRQVVVEVFEKFEKQVSKRLLQKEFERQFNHWTANGYAIRFANRLCELLQGSFLRGAPNDELTRYVRAGIAMSIGLEEEVPSRTRALELKRLIRIADVDSQDHKININISNYSTEIRAVRKRGDTLELTAIGDVFLGLSGRDAVQWLLSIEVTQATGPQDIWRLSLDTASTLLKAPSDVRPYIEWEYAPLPFNWPTLRRLEAMELVYMVDIDNGLEFGYRLLEPGIRALTALTSGDTPFSALAATLSQGESLATLEAGSGKPLTAMRFNAAAEATARQARLVAHEIRNTLLPAQSALDSLYSNLVGQQVEEPLSRLRPRIDTGLDRALSFVRELLTVSELATQPQEPFDIARAIDEARAGVGAALDIQVSGTPETPTMLEGYRSRFALALANLLRNSEQAGARQVRIDIRLDAGEQDLLLTVDDDGSGVPAEHRERIFQRGVSLRGGTGEGLALVKEVIEYEMQGKVACFEAPGGGARFLMRVPLKPRRLS